ncbi:MAG TPA: NAD(P)H-dependent oxidoreductase subunit E [Bacteriovoracaceae bacterium]|nr:NAD(P)H-dependent oxidoreductase subunit E [Bacteriovoracaceae bacterium]
MALSQQVKKTIDAIRSQFPTEQALLIPLLHEIQNEQGWVSLESMRAAGEFLNLPLSKVREVTSFYTMFKLAPQGKVDLQFCVNISCWLNGAEKLVACAEKKLGIKCGETSADGKFTLSEVECLASCGTAPVLQINQDYYENLTAPQLYQLIEQAEKDLAANKPVGKSTQQPGVWP